MLTLMRWVWETLEKEASSVVHGSLQLYTDLENARGYVKTLADSQSGVRTPDLKHVKETGTPPPAARGTPLLGLNRYEPLNGV